jgi:hypothetical protein
MKHKGWLVTALVATSIMAACGAKAQSMDCADRLAAAGFDPTKLRPGTGRIMEGRMVVIQPEDVPTTVCRRVDRIATAEKVQRERTAAMQQEVSTLKAQLAAANGKSFLDFVCNHVLEIVCICAVILGFSVGFWMGLFTGMKLRVR